MRLNPPTPTLGGEHAPGLACRAIFALGLAAETFFAVRAIAYYRRNPHG